jgi:DNA-binding transcriptional LysR family regulator
VLGGSLDGAFVCGPIDYPGLAVITAFQEELVLVTAMRWTSLAGLRRGTSAAGPTALVFRTGCSCRQRLEQVLAEFGWPSAARLEFGTLDGIIGCVAAEMGVTLLPGAVVERAEQNRSIRTHALTGSKGRVETLFIRRRDVHEDTALRSFVTCLKERSAALAA